MFVTIQGSVVSRDGSFGIASAAQEGGIFIPFNIRNDDDGNGLAVLFTGGASAKCEIFDHHGIIESAENEFQDSHFHEGDTFWPNGDGDVTYDSNIGVANLRNYNGVDKCWMYQQILAASSPAYLNFSVSGDGLCYLRVGTTLHGVDIMAATLYASGIHQVAITTGGAIYIEWRNEGDNNTSIDIIDPHYNAQASSIASFVNTTFNTSPYIHYALNEIDNKLIICAVDYDPSLYSFPISKYPQEILYTGGAWTIQLITFTSPPAAWASSYRPASCCFHQGRLWFVGKNTIWASQSGDYYNFDIGTALDNEAIVHDVAVEGNILWIKSLTQLIIGTTSGEYIIKSEGRVITPTDIDIETLSRFGSSPDQPVEAGDRILFISKDRRKIRSAYYDEFKKGWNMPNISFSGEHLTKAKIKNIHYARDPYDIICCVFQDGSYATCTYEQYLEINAWAKHTNSNYSQMIAASSVHNDDGDDIFTYAAHSYNSLGSVNASHLGEEISPYLDTSFIRPIESDGKIRDLDILGDGAPVTVKIRTNSTFEVHPSTFTVNGAGEIVLQGYTSGVAIVGLSYSQKIITLPMDIGSSSGSGSGMMKHVNKIFARLYESALPLINGKRSPDRSPSTPMGHAEGIITGDIQVTNIGNDRQSPITIEQDLPLRLEVTGIFGEIGQKGL